MKNKFGYKDRQENQVTMSYENYLKEVADDNEY